MSTPLPDPSASASEDVTEFLQTIKGLGERRDEEDELRNKKLEEDIIQGRKERQLRRAERARSISPTKSSPSTTPTASRTSASQPSNLSETLPSSIDTPPGDAHDTQHDTATDDPMNRVTASPASPSRGNSSIHDRENIDPSQKRTSASPSNAMPSRSSPLSWQRRPVSQAGDHPRSRPLSMVAVENAARSPKVSPEPSPALAEDAPLSREQIARSLASKDPAWFRQTADRGADSPAYRKNQVEDEDRADHGSNSSRVQMPGMARKGSDTQDTTGASPIQPLSPTRSSIRTAPGSRNSALGSPMPMTSAQRFEPPSADSMAEARVLAMSPTQGRISPERLDRPASPTKGMGGFVQSAMMKRSDSVSKRWSVQSPPSLNRGNSVASNRSSHDPSTPLAGTAIAGAKSRPISQGRDTPKSTSRPTSSHNNNSDEAVLTSNGNPKNNPVTSVHNDGFVKPGLPASRSATPQNLDLTPRPRVSLTDTPPTSPSKTLDTRRWSPTKSSWLESALNKPDSPKPKPTPPPQQPSWMVEINKAKQKSVDLGRSPTNTPKHEVSIGGLMRSPPPGSLGKAAGLGLAGNFSSSPAAKARSESISSINSRLSSSQEQTSSGIRPSTTTVPSTASPTLNKAKPETPPKKDFRANLKPRQAAESTTKDEPEFKNVFGQLRRTKTQNYVAPDELKNNITRGKAALNLTGGPKKTERVDEFKEAILKKKDDFKKAQIEGKGVVRSDSTSKDSAIPEALAKRQAMSATASPSLGARASSKSISTTDEPSAGKEAIGGKLAGRLNPALAGLLARGPPSSTSETSRSSSLATSQRTTSMSTSTTVETAEPVAQLTHMTKSRARGPRRKAPSAHISATTSQEPEPVVESNVSLVQSGPSASPNETVTVSQTTSPSPSDAPPSSTHRAKEPKANTTKVDPVETISQPPSPRKLDMKRRSQFLQETPNKSTKSELQFETPKPLSPTKKANSDEITLSPRIAAHSSITTPAPKPKPEPPIKSPTLSPKIVSPQQFSPESAKLRPAPLSPKKNEISEESPKPAATPARSLPQNPEVAGESPRAQTMSPESLKLRPAPLSPTKTKTDKSTDSNGIIAARSLVHDPKSAPFPEQASSPPSVKTSAALWNIQSVEHDPVPRRAPSPIKLPTHADETAAMIEAGLHQSSSMKANDSVPGVLQPKGARPLPVPPLKTPVKSQLSPISTASPNRTSAKTILSPTSQNSEATRLVSNFFGANKRTVDFRADTASILGIRPNQDTTVDTLNSFLYQVHPDGKKQAVPNHQERLLFEGNMYLCVHSFVTSAGKKMVEVYFWVGDEVPDATAEKVKPYCQKEARAAGGKLIHFKQGKETPGFFSALGGIAIFRRGTSNKYDSLAPHILCGRKHFGQIAFDEVDYSAASLCSGFPYLISTQSGKSYLWKGKGSGIEELSCARLIGMDFGLMGEIEEVEDGKEPSAFLKIFGNGEKIPVSADHWRMKPNFNKYCARLFRAEATTKAQIVEISPFCQADVSPSEIYVLDAFFEIYIIVGAKSQSQYAAYHNALMFAQEYGILAAGMEDRPYVPVTTVVMEGIPKDMKSVFRKWSDRLAPTLVQPSSPGPGLQRSRSLRLLSLNVALEATRGD